MLLYSNDLLKAAAAFEDAAATLRSGDIKPVEPVDLDESSEPLAITRKRHPRVETQDPSVPDFAKLIDRVIELLRLVKNKTEQLSSKVDAYDPVAQSVESMTEETDAAFLDIRQVLDMAQVALEKALNS